MDNFKNKFEGVENFEKKRSGRSTKEIKEKTQKYVEKIEDFHFSDCNLGLELFAKKGQCYPFSHVGTQYNRGS